MSKKLKKKITRVAIGALVYFGAILMKKVGSGFSPNLILIAFLAAYFIIGGNVVKTAVRNIGKGQVFDENFLMAIATVGAFIVGDYSEAVAVMLFYQVGECFQAYAVNRSRKSIAELMNIRPDFANVIREGEIVTVSPENVLPGEIILVKPGEKVPLDGTVTKGSSSLDTMALTGESLPRDVEESEEVISGCVNLSGVLEIRVSKSFGESTVAKILDLVENAGNKKSKSENFISKFAKYYTPVVVLLAVLLAVIPPLLGGGEWSVWIYRALSFLVISCPCALVISIPLSFFGGLGGASRAGVLVKGSNYLEALADTQLVVMDKTGTLTKGNFALAQKIPAENISEEELLETAAYVESYSNHPISQSLVKAYGRQIDAGRVLQVTEIAGHGIGALLDGKQVYAGNEKLMKLKGIDYREPKAIGTVVHVSVDQKWIGCLVIADEIKPDSRQAIEALYKAGVDNVVMLTGDRKEVADQVAASLGIRQVYSELLPGDKVSKVEELFSHKTGKGKLVFVGDGINDAPVLARADIGIAMGGLGSDAAIEAADVVIMTDEPSKIAQAIKISKSTLVIVKQNIVFAIGVKIAVLALAAIGYASMGAAVFADVGVAFLAILNAMRVMKVK